MATLPAQIDNLKNTDPRLSAAQARVKSVAQALQAKGIVDTEGRRMRQDLPADMNPELDRDFGG